MRGKEVSGRYNIVSSRSVTLNTNSLLQNFFTLNIIISEVKSIWCRKAYRLQASRGMLESQLSLHKERRNMHDNVCGSPGQKSNIVYFKCIPTFEMPYRWSNFH